MIQFLKGLSWQIYAGLAALALLGGTVWYCQEQVEDKVEQAEVIGQKTEQNKQLEKTIENVKTAEQAREDINETGPAGDLTRYNQCLRTARTPSNCERFMPNVQEDKR